MPDYPEHEKLRAIQNDSQKIGQFLDWCYEQGWELCCWHESDLVPINKNIQTVLADYFEIDLKKLEAEKVAMIEECRKAGA